MHPSRMEAGPADVPTPPGRLRAVRGTVILPGMAALLFVLGLALNGPLFMEGETPYRDSIEGGYASMVRFVWENPNPWGWNPMQYGGLPTQFTYLPVPLYAGAVVAWVTGIQPEYAHRLVSSTFALLGPITLFAFILFFTGRRWWAFGTALAYTLVCPLYGLTLVIGNDRGYAQLPWRLQVLAKYGEGPHNVGLALIPVALIAVWLAATRRNFRFIFLAAAAAALVALTNWIAALALAICCVLLIIAAFREPEFETGRVVAAGALGYLLACFWLTPSFIGTTAFNWPTDAFNYQLHYREWLMMAGLIAGILAIRTAGARIRHWYATFLLLSVFTFGWIALGFYWARVDTIPESRRYALEFSLFLFAGGCEILRRLFDSRRAVMHGAALAGALIILALGFHQARLYATQGWLRWQPFPKERAVEYRLAKWVAASKPEGRVFATGGVRFRLNSWFQVPQVGGTFESGLRNRLPLHLSYSIRTNSGSRPGEVQDALLSLRALGVEYVIVTAAGSKEHYRDFRNPALFDEVLEKVYASEHEWIYRVPFTSYAYQARAEHMVPFHSASYELQSLKPYLEQLDQLPLRTGWQGPSRMRIEGPVDPSLQVATKVNYDAGWSAVQDGRELALDRSPLGYLAIQPHSAGPIDLDYRGTAEQRLAAVVSGIAWIFAIARSLRRPRDRPDLPKVFQHI